MCFYGADFVIYTSYARRYVCLCGQEGEREVMNFQHFSCHTEKKTANCNGQLAGDMKTYLKTTAKVYQKPYIIFPFKSKSYRREHPTRKKSKKEKKGCFRQTVITYNATPIPASIEFLFPFVQENSKLVLCVLVEFLAKNILKF